jgi:hypothetical protein
MLREMPESMTMEEQKQSKWWYGSATSTPHALYMKLGERVNSKRDRDKTNGMYTNITKTLHYNTFQELWNMRWEQPNLEGLEREAKKAEKTRWKLQNDRVKVVMTVIQKTMKSPLMLSLAYGIKLIEAKQGATMPLSERLRIIKVCLCFTCHEDMSFTLGNVNHVVSL